MKRTLLSLLALFFPWIAFLILEKPIAALGALALQLTFVGWLPAGFWAWSEVRQAYAQKEPLLSPQPQQAPNTPKHSDQNQNEIKKTIDADAISPDPKTISQDEPPQS